MTIKAKIFGVLGLIVLLTIGGFGVAIVKLVAQGPELERTENQVGLVSHSSVPLLISILEIKADVLQVQGWLTDIAATRGLPGFDDGFAEAAGFAKKFEEDVSLARGHAVELKIPEVLTALDALQAAFPPFYAGGQEMAQAYVNKGPEGGNPQMQQFDSVAGTMSETMDKLVKLVEEKTSTNLSDLQALVKEQREGNDVLIRLLIILSVIAAVAMVVGVIVLYRTITNSFKDLNEDVGMVMSDDVAVTLNLSPDRQDEFGPIASALAAFMDNKAEAAQMADERRKARAEQLARAETLQELANDFDSHVRTSLTEMRAATGSMEHTAEGMASTTQEATTQATAVAAASEEASTNVATVAAAAEELSSSINEIRRQVSQSSDVAGKAVTDAAQTNEQIQGLAEAANKIGEVVALINDIADQTNLLALNATIEAARAGDAGKGFAVVASEVKNLANQTSKATEEVGSQINNIQRATQDAVVAIQRIAKTITEIDEIGAVIAVAVDEQGSATQEIARNVEQAATGTTEVSYNITGVNNAVGNTGQAATQVIEAVETLTAQSDNVSSHVEEFLRQIKAV